MSSETLPITRRTLGQRIGLGALELEAELSALDRAGLIDACRLRLTLPGLATAVAMRASSSRSARVKRVTRITKVAA